MDVDPPFFQKETESSNEGNHNVVPSHSPLYRHGQGRGQSFRQSLAKSSSADDYRSVIDDLTIENKRLREELRRLKQMGPDSLRDDKLFEVKFHGLPSTKKRELEATLRDFTTKLERSSTKTSTSRKKALTQDLLIRPMLLWGRGRACLPTCYPDRLGLPDYDRIRISKIICEISLKAFGRDQL
ncbi:hypothetical protein ONZ43_g7678 [Nemania bipapillata]|uniref:Uncharacterized protein n=1 Tax=Nemania bipapillata TaxID=110536 RepID=A0ACC2HPC7_9PEZI|nr:hypothetical protein ONZ43_g7678 [Nemania bipapillata]